VKFVDRLAKLERDIENLVKDIDSMIGLIDKKDAPDELGECKGHLRSARESLEWARVTLQELLNKYRFLVREESEGG